MESVTLSLISHTNVGKTTLARTLLREDVGEALDHAHVTDENVAYALAQTESGAQLTLWDTPGFGDTARLMKRLRKVGSPVGWVLHQVWDRITDRPLWCSQQAVLNVRDEADVVLYLVNAAEDPAAAGYVGLEMEVLEWIGKPVILLLNQTGSPGSAEQEAEEEARWRDHLKNFSVLREVVELDAFARCWVQENELLDIVESVLPDGKKALAAELGAVWRRRNLDVFEASVKTLANQLAESVTDQKEVSSETLLQKFWIGRGELNAEMREARKELAERLAQRTQASTNRLIELHTIDGETRKRLKELSKENFAQPERVNESVWSALGGVAAGATAGLAADLAHGGLTFGGGALLGGIGGGAGAYFLAKSLNLTRGKGNGVFWTLEHFRQQAELAILSYLAVAHHGRGRGAWEDGETPEIWRTETERVLESRDAQLEKVWKNGTEGAASSELEEPLESLVRDLLESVLGSLYPGTKAFRR